MPLRRALNIPRAILSLRTNDSLPVYETYRSQARRLPRFGCHPTREGLDGGGGGFARSVVGPFLPGSCQIWITSHERSPSVAAHINLGSTHLSYASHLRERASVNLGAFVVSIKRWKFCSFGCISCFIRVIAVVYCVDSCQRWRALPSETPLWLSSSEEESVRGGVKWYRGRKG